MNSLKGVEAGRYYTDRLPSYYLDGEEPPGRWWGKATGRLSLSGEVDPEAFLAVMAGRDPATGVDLGRRFGEGSVRGYDATFSAPKSVSVLFAVGDDRVRDEVVEAHERAVEAVLAWVEDHAHTRMRRHGHIMCVDAGGLVVGLFRQHTSRRLDPQLHTHAVISNRVSTPDGRWLALDARSMMVDQRTLSALYHACLRSELTRRLGVEWETPEHGISEIAGIPEVVLAEFSQRSSDVERRLEQKLERFRSNLDREPSGKERWRLEREAVLDSRPAKPHGVSLTQLHEEWTERTLQAGHDPQRLVRAVTGRHRRLDEIDHQVTTTLGEAALRALGDRQSSWRHAELVRELAGAVPTTVAVDSVDLTEALDGLADHIADSRCVDISRPIPPATPLRRDGRPITEAAVDRALTTRAILEEEEELITRAQHRKDRQKTRTRTRVIRFGRELTPGQQEAMAAVVGDGGLELIVGPAGAGKTTVLAKAELNLAVQGRQAFGVAPTAAAAEVLATETGMRADTLDKLLTEHLHPSRPPDPVFNLVAGTTVIVDEAATASTPKLAALFRLADQHDWRVILVGDPRQFAAVGRGGMFAHLVDSHGAVELDQVHRFHHPWERQASLRLRAGDPAVLSEYERRGRIHGGTLEQMEAEVVGVWQEARDRGETVALMANSTDTVARLNQLAQQTRVKAKELDPNGVRLRVGETMMLVGDEVVTRRNDRRLRTDRGVMVKNRDHWTITEIHRDRSVTLTGRTGRIRLPADYVAEDLELGYAQTSHATQGRTVDTALLLVDTPTDSRGVYTPMTRGRDANHAYIVTEANQTALDVLTHAVTREWIDQPAIARKTQLEPNHAQRPDPAGPGDEAADIDELERHIRRLNEQRRARTREVERTRGRGL
ncbi:MAG TPA: MobF family relaxase [Acidimicrobiia bacterium]|nr:MobF family relaxase [Acidimicrobiia bacterium]